MLCPICNSILEYYKSAYGIDFFHCPKDCKVETRKISLTEEEPWDTYFLEEEVEEGCW